MLVFSLVPTVPELPSTGWDKSNHFLGFITLTVLGRQGYPRQGLALFTGLLVFGGLIEVLQMFTDYRHADWADWLADDIGVLAGYTLDMTLRRYFSLRP
jgi:VanZ family protein